MDAQHPGRVERVDGNAAGGRLLAVFGTHLVTGGRAMLSLGALTRLDWAVDAADAPEVGPAGIEPTTSTV